MACKCNQIINHMCKIAPAELIQDWDNSGLLLGDPEQDINKILVVLDITQEIIDEAIENKVELIITHHPLIFNPIHNLRKDIPQENNLINLIKNDISVYSAHTNLDLAINGVNDTLASILQLEDVKVLKPILSKTLLSNHPYEEEYGFAKIGKLKEIVNLETFTKITKEILGLKKVRLVGNIDKKIKNVVISAGSYNNITMLAKSKGADVIFTGDLKYHDAREIEECGLTAVDAGHFGTENVIIPVIIEHLLKLGTGIEIIKSEKSKDVFITL